MDTASEKDTKTTSIAQRWNDILNFTILSGPEKQLEASEQEATGSHYSYKYDVTEKFRYKADWLLGSTGERIITVALKTPFVDDNSERNPPIRAHISVRTTENKVISVLEALTHNADYLRWLNTINSSSTGSEIPPLTVTLPSVIFHRLQYLGANPLESWDSAKAALSTNRRVGTSLVPRTQIFAERDVEITIKSETSEEKK